MRTMTVLLALSLAACGNGSKSQTYTLYRNSPLDGSMRVKWASFDSRESDLSYNRNNCEMAARLLNANLHAFRRANGEEAPSGVGFWCEPGAYSEKGSVPGRFDAEFPTDVPEVSRVPA